MKVTSVYLVGCPCRLEPTPFTYAVKVGITNSFSSRMDSLSTGNPHDIDRHFVFDFPSRDLAMRIEREFHERFDHFRLKGEWFSMPPRMALFMLTIVIARSISGIDGLRTDSGLQDAIAITDKFSSDEQIEFNERWEETE